MEEKQPFFVRHRAFPLYFMLVVMAWNTYWFVATPFSWFRLFNLVWVPALLMAGFYWIAGHPRNWWRMYFGTYVSIGGSDRAAEYPDADAVDVAISQWIKESGIGIHYKHGSYYYQFLRKKDAVHFKVAWG